MGQTLKFMVIAALGVATSVAGAHHSYAMFDITRLATVQGTVKVVEWTNPHVWLWIDRDATTTFGFETVSPGELSRFHGWSLASLRVGQKVTVEYAPLRSGRNGGVVRRITLADGKVLTTPLTNFPVGGPPAGSGNAKR